MGDRCRVVVTCRTADEALFREIGFGKEFDGDEPQNGVSELVDNEANYAAWSELRELAGKGIVFFGHHHEGVEYGPSKFASDGKAVHFVDVDWGGNVTIPVKPGINGLRMDKKHQRALMQFFRVLDRAEAFVYQEQRKRKGAK